MANYSFVDLLSPLDFEYLVRDLLSRDLNKEFMAFAEGKDKGTDLRYSKSKRNNIIVQCKRVKAISKKELDEEVVKIQKINPKKYYLAFACDISVDFTDHILKQFSSWMTDDKNIYTKNRLNDLLDKHRDILQKHYKLWLNSAIIFNSIINQPLFERAKSLIADIKRDYKYYVRNESISRAFEILNENKFIVISGIPGIGKTTLAKLILWEYLQKEFEIIEIHRVTEGEKILIENSENKQVFYFDDFLGENFLKYDVIEGRASDLIQFLKRIKNSKNKILIMTTREYILNQAKDVYEKLDSPELDIVKYTLDLSSYSKKIKSLILYNHLYYSGLQVEYIEAILKDKTYKKIIEHQNYSPRIIEQLTVKLNNVSVDDYAKEFIKSLDYPLGIWDKAFKSQISEGARFFLFILISMSEQVLLSDFKVAMENFYKYGGKERGIDFKPLNYRIYLKELENSFIKINITNKKNHYLDFQNPSIKDFLINIIKQDKEIIKLLLSTSMFYNQFIYTLRYLTGIYLNDIEIQELADSIIFQRFDSFENSSIIFSKEKEEFHFKLSKIKKIDSLKFFLNKAEDRKILPFILNHFLSIDLKNMFYDDEGKYISFYREYYNKLNITLSPIISQVVENIRYYGNVKNLSLLSKIDQQVFNEYVQNNIEYIQEKITTVIKSEIDRKDTENSLSYFKTTLDSDEEDLSIFSISYSDFEEDFEEKRNKILEDKGVEIDEEPVEIEPESLINYEDEAFDEDELFKIEMFN